MGSVAVSAAVVTVEQTDAGLWRGRFAAMACPCEILVDTDDAKQAREWIALAHAEALRIEHAFSRYRSDNVIHQINSAQGQTITVDAELAALLTYADLCFQLSQGLFDISSGVLRRAWCFDGSDRLPEPAQINALLPFVGWDKVEWQSPHLQLPAGMEIDLGGLGKEYAVDRVITLAGNTAPVLVNFGGDLAANQPQRNGKPWIVAIENPEIQQASALQLHLKQGAITTSGDSRRFLLRDGIRYSHILNPKTGWPVEKAPRSVTVLANTCLEAGLLSTLAMLQGQGAESFLAAEQIENWVIR